ncbi:hypothetical protein ColLi_09280 [Colletotrichum liriopes]|uniref:Uncharacterized protein n=1 Tax=Colletotrichum liriopes TaxID=708192 RepID=A0AA37LVX3_9PEZI|nr:hypothetical protein ColLi_09280 [Colletotrichum liriopes]
MLPNTNVFVNWGEAGAITEFSEDGEVLFHAYLDSGGYSVQNYRGFRSNWTGNPREEPVLLAMYGVAAGEIDAYISWNGDTEVAVWKFYAEPLEDRNQERILLGQVRRTGFETYLKLDSGTVTGEILVSAQALDASNRVLANTNSVVILRNPLGPSGLSGKPSQEVSFEEL